MRNYSLDTLRFIASFLVVTIHVSASFVMEYKFSGNVFWIANILDSFSRVSVPIFIIISGHFLLNQNVNNFYNNRLKKLLIPMFFWTLFYLFYNYIPVIRSNSGINWTEILEKILYGKAYYHLWYVYMIFGLYLLTPLIKKIIDKVSNPLRTLIVVLLFILGALSQYFSYKNSVQIPFFLQFFDYLGYYILGGLVIMKRSSLNKSVFLLGYFLFSFLTAYLIYYFEDFYFYQYLSISVILASICLFVFFSKILLRQNIFSNLSKYTFGIYLVHPFILSRILKLNYNFSIFEILFICFFISLLLSLIIYKIPYLRKII